MKRTKHYTYNEIRPIWDTIKIGRKIITINKGDYIQDNGATIIFVAGDGRVLQVDTWTMLIYVCLPKSIRQTIPFTKMKKTILEKSGTNLTRYFF